MSTDPESFVARWSRLKRAAERVSKAADAAQEPPAGARGPAVEGDARVPAEGTLRGQASVPEVPLPPIDSLDGLRSDYEAFFQQPVDDELRHAALKKLFADPHFNQMDMLDVYVDDYTQFEPLPAELRMRLPSARSFLSDSERAAVEAAEAAEGDPAASSLVDGASGRNAAAAAGDEAVDGGIGATPGSLAADGAVQSAAVKPDRPVEPSSSISLPSEPVSGTDPTNS